MTLFFEKCIDIQTEMLVKKWCSWWQTDKIFYKCRRGILAQAMLHFKRAPHLGFSYKNWRLFFRVLGPNVLLILIKY